MILNIKRPSFCLSPRLRARELLLAERFVQSRVFFHRATSHLARGDVSWHGIRAGHPDWTPGSHSLAWTLEGCKVHVIANAWWRELEFELPQLPVKLRWHRLLDTSLAAPQDIVPLDQAPEVTGRTYEAGWHSVVVLKAI